jgi:hypothetical protein
VIDHRRAYLAEMLKDNGFVHLVSQDFRALLNHHDATEWADFAATWNGMPLDREMADGGKYRRRRYGAFRLYDGSAILKPHQPHYQSREYNPLNGGRQRWYAPISEEFIRHPVLAGIWRLLTPLFSTVEGRGIHSPWDGELHQFRIEASPSEAGQPTPEGLHRDGVDWVLVMLVNRVNVTAGSTNIIDEGGRHDGFVLLDPGETVLLNDRRVRHGVTAIHALDPTLPAYRDALVVTWKAL